MVIAHPIPAGEYVPTADQRVVRYGVPWEHFEAELAVKGESSVPRLAFLMGALELMTPSRHHERLSSTIAQLLTVYALERRIELGAYGSWTLKNRPEAAGLEPDECFIVGADQSRGVPDLAIEVIWTSGGIDKLEIYRRLGVGEVWLWREGRIEIHVLRDDDYVRAPLSRLFPDLDLDELCSCLDLPTTTQAIRAFREKLGRR
jgi:Uma2 family endonuclease